MIAIAHYSAPGDIGGVTTWLADLILGLHAEGLAIAVLLHHFGDDPEQSDFRKALCAAGVTVESEVRPAYTEDAVAGTLQFLERHQPRVFLPHSLDAFFYAGAIAGDQGLPWAFTVHSDDPVYWAALELCQPEKHGGVVVTVSEHIARVSSQTGRAEKPVVIPYGIEIRPRTARFTSAPFTVVYSGRVLEEQKRISLVLETLAQACAADSRIEARIVGGGAALEESRLWVAARGLSHRILFTGRLAVEGVQEELGRAQCILLMSDYEGLPVALLEAMALGVVPVVRDIPSGIPELVKQYVTGILVDDRPETAAKAILELANDAALWTRCSDGAATLIAERYSLERCRVEWRNVIEELSSRGGAREAFRAPSKIRLPRQHIDLAGRDLRRLSLAARVLWKLRRTLSSTFAFRRR